MDRVAILSQRKRKAGLPQEAGVPGPMDSKLAKMGSATGFAVQQAASCCSDAVATQNTADSARTCCASLHAASEDIAAADVGSGRAVDQQHYGEAMHCSGGGCSTDGGASQCSEVEGPLAADANSDAALAAAPAPGGAEAAEEAATAYIKGTRLVVGGWFRACRGCNEPTAHTIAIRSDEVPLCGRCGAKYHSMVSGAYPLGCDPTTVDPALEPLCMWLPRLLPQTARMTDEARTAYCNNLVLRQHEAWMALESMSEPAPST